MSEPLDYEAPKPPAEQPMFPRWFFVFLVVFVAVVAATLCWWWTYYPYWGPTA